MSSRSASFRSELYTVLVALGVSTAACDSGSQQQPIDEIRAMVDAAAAARSAIVLTGSQSDTYANAIVQRLQGLGYTAATRSASAPPDAAFSGATLLVVSPSAPAGTASQFADLTLPTIALSGQAWRDMKLLDTRPAPVLDANTGLTVYPTNAPARGQVTASTATDTIVNPDANEIVDGVPALPAAVCADAALIESSTPADAAIPILWLDAAHTKTAAFAFEPGASMTDDFTAPARRVALPGCMPSAGQPATAQPTDRGLALFDAAVRWVDPPRYSGGTTSTALQLRDGVLAIERQDGYSYAVIRRTSIDVAFTTATFVPQVGQTWVGSTMGGYMRRITEIAPGPFGANSYHVTTTQASLTDLYSDGDMTFATAQQQPVPTNSLVRGVRRALGDQATTNVSLGAGLSIGQFCTAQVAAAIAVKPEISLEVKPVIELHFKADGLESAKIAAQAQGKLGLTITGSADFTAACTATFDSLPSVKFRTVVPIPVGPVVIPVFIEHELKPVISFTLSGSLSGGNFTARGAGTAAITAGMEYKNGAWSPLWEPTTTTEFKTDVNRPGTLTASLSAKTKLEYTGKVYGLIGPRIALIADATGTFSMDPNVCKWTATGKVKLSAEAGLSTGSCSGGEPGDPAKVEEMFKKRYGLYTGKERATMLTWYKKGFCAPTIALGRFPEFQKTGLPYLDVVPGSDWTPAVNRAWVYGNIDNGGSFVLATDPRLVRARFGDSGVEDPPGSGMYRTTSTCDRRTITADELDLLQSEGYRTVLLTTSPAEQASCTCSGGCPVPAVPTLPKVLPPKGNFATLLTSAANLTFDLFESQPISIAGPIDPDGTVLVQCRGRCTGAHANDPECLAPPIPPSTPPPVPHNCVAGGLDANGRVTLCNGV